MWDGGEVDREGDRDDCRDEGGVERGEAVAEVQTEEGDDERRRRLGVEKEARSE